VKLIDRINAMPEGEARKKAEAMYYPAMDYPNLEPGEDPPAKPDDKCDIKCPECGMGCKLHESVCSESGHAWKCGSEICERRFVRSLYCQKAHERVRAIVTPDIERKTREDERKAFHAELISLISRHDDCIRVVPKHLGKAAENAFKVGVLTGVIESIKQLEREYKPQPEGGGE